MKLWIFTKHILNVTMPSVVRAKGQIIQVCGGKKLRIILIKWEVVYLENQIYWKVEQIHKDTKRWIPAETSIFGEVLHCYVDTKKDNSVNWSLYMLTHQSEVFIDPEMIILEFTWFPHFQFLWTSKYGELAPSVPISWIPQMMCVKYSLLAFRDYLADSL